MRKEFLVTRQGKQFALYAGLLDMAHENGLKSIVTTLVQVPSQDNGGIAICQATVQMEDDRIFTGIGDAGPKSLAPIMMPHVIRMAETRAKSRALRDAVNVGVAAVEELGPQGSAEEEHSEYVETERPPSRNFAQEFKDRAARAGHDGKMSPLCAALVGKEIGSLQAKDYQEALKCSGSEWDKAVSAVSKTALEGPGK